MNNPSFDRKISKLFHCIFKEIVLFSCVRSTCQPFFDKFDSYILDVRFADPVHLQPDPDPFKKVVFILYNFT